MNEKVRTYLIEVARQKGKFAFYSDVVKDCNLGYDLNTEFGKNQLSDALRDVSIYENEHKRPLLSALAIYKDPKKNDQGPGFYKLAEQLGKGSFKKLSEELYGFEEAKACQVFWQNEENYQKYAHLEEVKTTTSNPENFFTREELEFFTRWTLKPYDRADKEHFDAKNYIMATVWEKSKYLGQRIVAQFPDFTMDSNKYWSQKAWNDSEAGKVQGAKFKPYTWVKLFRKTDKGKGVFFTFGIDGNQSTFLYKIDCKDQGQSPLNASQISLCKSLIPATAKWNVIAYDDLLKFDWEALTNLCVAFLENHLSQYDAIVYAVWGGAIPANLFKNRLIEREKPKGGATEITERAPNFTGVKIDHEAKAKAQKDLGNAGETLVKQHEIDFLKSIGRLEDAEKVRVADDGEGYDVLTFDEIGNEKYIEVKTTTGGDRADFYLSKHEVDFMRLNQNRYWIYRVYHYDSGNNFGEFYKISGDVESQLSLEPTQFKVSIKKEA